MADKLDMRMDPNWLSNIKIINLIEKLGAGAVLCLYRIYGYAAQYRQTGILTDMNDRAIERIALWDGEPGQLISTLLDEKLIQRRKNGPFFIHDWREHQPYVSTAKKRIKKAQKASKKRWALDDKKLSPCSNDNLAMLKSDFSNAPSYLPTIPTNPKKKAPPKNVDNSSEPIVQYDAWRENNPDKVEAIRKALGVTESFFRHELNNSRDWVRRTQVTDPVKANKTRWDRFLSNWVAKAKRDYEGDRTKPKAENISQDVSGLVNGIIKKIPGGQDGN